MNAVTYDLVIYGATSFVGQILCHYLCQEFEDDTLTWAMAGRSESKLNQVKVNLCKPYHDIPCLVADANDEAALRRLCSQARVVVSTVGPYALYGETLVKVCAESGTDYVDLTGEPQWIRRMIDRYETAARRSGARIVNCCGFDSIPSDLGVYFLQKAAQQQLGGYCQQVHMRVRRLQGGASGGTIASMVNVFQEARHDRQLRRELADPYSLCPPGADARPDQSDPGVTFDADFKAWSAPFVMAAINTRVVLRSNALMNPPYHRRFLYDEALLTGTGTAGRRRARRVALGMKLVPLIMLVSPLRWLALKFLPKPGEGPTPDQQRNGCFELGFLGITEQGKRLMVSVSGDRDPGYGATARMLAQAGICLAREIPKSSLPGGFWTPATAFGRKLIRRLIDHAGMQFHLISVKRNS